MDDMGGKAVVTAGIGAHILPQGARGVGHVGEIALDVVVQFGVQVVAVEQVKAQIVADEGVGGVDLGVQPLRPAVVAEGVDQNIPQFGVALGGGHIAEEGIILAGLGALTRQDQFAVHPHGVVAEEARFGHGHLGDGGPQSGGTGDEFVVPVQGAEVGEQARIEHIGGKGHILRQFIGFGPLQEHPTFQFLEKSELVLERLEIVEQGVHTGFGVLNEGAVAGAAEVLAEFHTIPHGPVGDKGAVVVVRGIAHGEHPLGEILELLGQKEILQKCPFKRGFSGQGVLHAGGKETVAEPAGALAGGAVHIDVHAVGAEGLHGGIENAAHGLVLTDKRRGDGRGGIGDVVQAQSRHANGGTFGHQTSVLHDVGHGPRQMVLPFLDADGQDIGKPQTETLDVAVDQNFVKEDKQFAVGIGLQVEIKNTRCVAREFDVGVCVGIQANVRGGLIGGGGLAEVEFAQLVVGEAVLLVLAVALKEFVNVDDLAGGVIGGFVGIGHLAAREQVHGQDILIVVVGDVAADEGAGFGRLHRQYGLIRSGVGLITERPEGQVIGLDEGALEGVALDAHDPLVTAIAKKPFPAGCGENLVPARDFGREEGGLVKVGKRIDIVPRHAQAHAVLRLGQIRRKVVLIHTEKPMGTARRAVGDIPTVDQENKLTGRGGSQFDGSVIGAGKVGAEGQGAVHGLRRADFPDGRGGEESVGVDVHGRLLFNSECGIAGGVTRWDGFCRGGMGKFRSTAERMFGCRKFETQFRIPNSAFRIFSKRPVAVLEDLDALARGGDGDDGEVVVAYHEVHVNHGVIDAHGVEFIEGIVVVVSDAVGKAGAEGEVAGGVLVKEGLVEGNAALTDGGGVGHKGALAEHTSAFVHGDHLAEKFLALFGVNFHRAAALKADREILDEFPAVGERQRGHDKSFGFAGHGRGEDLLGGDVGVELLAAQRVLTAAAEDALGNHIHVEIGAVRRLVLQGLDTQTVEVFATGAETLVVCLPFGHGVKVVAVLVNDAGGKENGLPEFFHGGGSANAGEHFLGPSLARDSGDAPLVLVLHGVAVGLDDAVTRLCRLGALLLIDAPQTVGIFRHNVEHGGQFIQRILQFGALEILHGGHGLEGLVAVVQASQGLVTPLHHHASGAFFVASFHAQSHEFGLVKVSLNDDDIAFFDGNAAFGKQTGIVFQGGFFHGL